MKFSELPNLSAGHFRHENKTEWLMIPGFMSMSRKTDDSHIEVEDGWVIVGVNRLKGSHLMIGREGQCAVMGWNPNEGYAWQHFPIYEDTWDFEVRGGVAVPGTMSIQ